MFMLSCPHYLIERCVATGDICSVYEWREKGSLSFRYPAGLPLLAMYAVEAFSGGISAGTAQQYEESKAKNG
jgi:hypothetical protein